MEPLRPRHGPNGPRQEVQKKKFEIVGPNPGSSEKSAASFRKEVCGHCNKPGHQERSCFIKYPEKVPFCTHCQLPGHYDSTCRIKRGSDKTASPNHRPKPWTADTETSRVSPLPFGPVLQTISRDQIEGNTIPAGQARIIELQDVSSYNWLKSAKPTIMIPGQPPTWTPHHDYVQLEEDHGIFYRDPNAAHFPTFPMEPAVRSVLQTNPAFPCSDVDVFGCGATLGNLLRYACGVDCDRAFRFRVDVIGDTVFFTRKENDPREIIPDVRGYGHTFPEAFTTWTPGTENSRTHQRVARYQLGGLNILIRFEGDAVYGGADTRQVVDSAVQAADVEALAHSMARSSINPRLQKPGPLALNIVRGGRIISQNMILDIKTRGKSKDVVEITAKEMPRLWIRQIPYFALAQHTKGLFRPHDMKVYNVKDKFEEWEQINREGICNLVSLIKKIVQFAKTTPSKKLEVCYSPIGERKLEFREQAAGLANILPDDLVVRWSGNRPRTGPLKLGPSVAKPSFLASTIPTADYQGLGRSSSNYSNTFRVQTKRHNIDSLTAQSGPKYASPDQPSTSRRVVGPNHSKAPLPAANLPVANHPVSGRPVVCRRIADSPVENRPAASRPLLNFSVTNTKVVAPPNVNRPVAYRPARHTAGPTAASFLGPASQVEDHAFALPPTAKAQTEVSSPGFAFSNPVGKTLGPSSAKNLIPILTDAPVQASTKPATATTITSSQAPSVTSRPVPDLATPAVSAPDVSTPPASIQQATPTLAPPRLLPVPSADVSTSSQSSSAVPAPGKLMFKRYFKDKL
ncbi:hypothetical protein FKW77_005547 [Venturia effusa]|uniref:CCHC-type domain-containing protein n=1 Tax=Venturia effusa TaxID=50376 RepID=A0A517LMY0_9PEZI|nr:hypothetical protein FKW77_005547 [Venturia effusa]